MKSSVIKTCCDGLKYTKGNLSPLVMLGLQMVVVGLVASVPMILYLGCSPEVIKSLLQFLGMVDVHGSEFTSYLLSSLGVSDQPGVDINPAHLWPLLAFFYVVLLAGLAYASVNIMRSIVLGEKLKSNMFADCCSKPKVRVFIWLILMYVAGFAFLITLGIGGETYDVRTFVGSFSIPYVLMEYFFMVLFFVLPGVAVGDIVTPIDAVKLLKGKIWKVTKLALVALLLCCVAMLIVFAIACGLTQIAPEGLWGLVYVINFGLFLALIPIGIFIFIVLYSVLYKDIKKKQLAQKK